MDWPFTLDPSAAENYAEKAPGESASKAVFLDTDSESDFAKSPEDAFVQKIRTYEQRVKENPESFRDWSRLSYFLACSGRYREAANAYARTLGIKPDAPRILCNYGTVLERLGYYGEAVESYSRALVVSPRYFKAMYG
ncbi:MAG: hypothetical protein WBD47_22750, partial [Phormidesmis sp.]